jgi:catechol 2,3-dioxygenase-like lactoylglutathione lyase family enzyme
MTESTSDLGFTHVALVCTDAERTIDFYQRYAGLSLVHDRTDRDGDKDIRVFGSPTSSDRSRLYSWRAQRLSPHSAPSATSGYASTAARPSMP